MDLGLLIIRVVFGLLMIGHGTQKLFGWFGGYGLNGSSGFVASRGFAPAKFWTATGSLSESVVGFHWPKFWASDGGYEHALAMLTAAVAVGITGPGAYSLDAVLGTAVPPMA